MSAISSVRNAANDTRPPNPTLLEELEEILASEGCDPTIKALFQILKEKGLLEKTCQKERIENIVIGPCTRRPFYCDGSISYPRPLDECYLEWPGSIYWCRFKNNGLLYLAVKIRDLKTSENFLQTFEYDIPHDKLFISKTSFSAAELDKNDKEQLISNFKRLLDREIITVELPESFEEGKRPECQLVLAEEP